jgi:hypothetical protein
VEIVDYIPVFRGVVLVQVPVVRPASEVPTDADAARKAKDTTRVTPVPAAAAPDTTVPSPHRVMIVV